MKYNIGLSDLIWLLREYEWDLVFYFCCCVNIVFIISLFNYSHIRFETMSYSILSLIKSQADNTPISQFMYRI